MSLSESDKAWGMFATAVALKTKLGLVTAHDRLKLATRTIDLMAERPEIGAIFAAFERELVLNPYGAGELLQDFVIGWQRDPSLARSEAVLAECKDQFGNGDWQGRADCGL